MSESNAEFLARVDQLGWEVLSNGDLDRLISLAKQAPEWVSVETPPEVEMPVLVDCEFGRVVACWWGDVWQSNDELAIDIIGVTHWMHLPAAPDGGPNA